MKMVPEASSGKSVISRVQIVLNTDNENIWIVNKHLEASKKWRDCIEDNTDPECKKNTRDVHMVILNSLRDVCV